MKNLYRIGLRFQAGIFLCAIFLVISSYGQSTNTVPIEAIQPAVAGPVQRQLTLPPGFTSFSRC
jgi:hypothetical protein